VVGLTLGSLPVVFYGASLAVRNNVNRVEDWLPKSFTATQHLAWFRHHFAADQFVILSWPGCQLGNPDAVTADSATNDDPRLERLAQLLVPAVGDQVGSATVGQATVGSGDATADGACSADVAACKRYFKSVVTSRHLLDRLTSPPLNLPREVAIERLQGTMLGPDGRQSCLVVTLQPAALGEIKQVLGSGQARVFRPDIPPGLLRRLIAQAGIAQEDVHLGGPPVDNNAIDEEGERTLVRLAGLSGLLGLGLAWWSLRSVLLTIIVFMCGLISAATSLAIVALSGQNLDAILMSMPSLVYVLAISGAVHLVNYYREAVQTGGMERAAERAVQHAWKPALLCSITTAVGLLSLSVSELVPIRKFGIFSAAGVMSLVGIIFFFLPAALHLSRIGTRWLGTTRTEPKRPLTRLPYLSNARKRACNGSPGALSVCPRTDQAEHGFWYAWASALVTHYRWVAAGCALLTVGVGMGLTRSSSSIDLLKLFDHRARILQDYRWLEANLGKLVPLEIVIRFPVETQREAVKQGAPEANWTSLSFLQRLEAVSTIQAIIDRKFGPAGSNVVGHSLSAASFTPVLPKASSGNWAFVQRKAVEARLRTSQQAWREAGFFQVDPDDGTELWRISLRVAAFRDVDYGQFVKELEQITQPVLAAYDARSKVLSHMMTEGLRAEGAGGSLASKRVLLWNPPPGAANPTHSAQTFQSVLQRLLEEYRCTVQYAASAPSYTPLSELELFDKLDAVVASGDFTREEWTQVTAVIPGMIDARSSGFSPSAVRISRNNPPLPDQHASARSTATSVSSHIENGNQTLSAIYTGVVPIVYQAQRALLNSLIESTWWSFLTITPIMMIVSRSILAGATAMIPNALPVLMIFGGMGWLDIPIDIGSMMTASIALGVAVDDTIHFLARYREQLDRTPDRQQAIVLTYTHCAVPTLQAALISGLGLSVFAFSTFTPTQRFGWLMLCILLAGVVSELVLLPALLASPLGKVFSVRGSATAQESANETQRRGAA
jgi:predicted RND superfamily exporter protein